MSLPDSGVFRSFIASSTETDKLSMIARTELFFLLRHHRTIASASLRRLFAPLLQFEKREIHTVFLRFPNFELGQKILSETSCRIARYCPKRPSFRSAITNFSISLHMVVSLYVFSLYHCQIEMREKTRNIKEPLIKSARSGSERFFVRTKHQKQRNTLCISCF